MREAEVELKRLRKTCAAQERSIRNLEEVQDKLEQLRVDSDKKHVSCHLHSVLILSQFSHEKNCAKAKVEATLDCNMYKSYLLAYNCILSLLCYVFHVSSSFTTLIMFNGNLFVGAKEITNTISVILFLWLLLRVLNLISKCVPH